MRRKHLIEIHDQAWFPSFLRDMMTDTLQSLWSLADVYRPIVPRLRGALHDAGACQVVDLCSGAGGPWLQIHRALEGEGYPPIHICLTDKYPNARALERASIRLHDRIKFHECPVDAMHVPPELHGFRTLFTSFHHFRAGEARHILHDAVECNEGIGVFEVPSRHPIAILCAFLIPIVHLLLAPFMRPFRWSRLIWTYLIPVIPIVLLFDGVTSCVRTYSPQELRELAKWHAESGYMWDIGEERGGFFLIPITYLIGRPSSWQPASFSEGGGRTRQLRPWRS